MTSVFETFRRCAHAGIAGIAGVLGITVGVRTMFAQLPAAPILLAW